ncbi:UDP-glycosyltransferase UGT5-like [Episyrphus balteatus]|uniref:UDP-glycosyltransferase UGT5-like n=1 Tax=Episyrphus balteatus TaxID=286459 RepID=UPI0024858428|nr:UDP-glycosyltransferase UGT5-like [Episyrphus balteatus]
MSIKFKCTWLPLFICIVAAATLSNIADGYKILGVFPIASKSHFIIGDALMRGLAEKGHDVTVISPYPMRDKKYHGIEVKALVPVMNGLIKDFLDLRDLGFFQTFSQIYEMGILATNVTLNEPLVQKLMKSKAQFDVIVMDLFVDEALFGFTELFNASMIATGLFGATSWNTDLVGTPSPPSYVPNPFSALTDQMSLFERIENLAILTFENTFFNWFYLPRQEEMLRKYFPTIKTSLNELRKNTAMVLLNQHVSLSFPRPYLPNMIEVGGLHINRKRKNLPANMQKFLDEAKDGAIYFSMGSNLKSKNLPAEKREAILRTFKSLKQKVLWKFEDTNLPGKSDNVFISDWFPQDDVLAHPNVKLFITHGGLLSTTESIYHGKPFIGIPIFGDQFLNMARAETSGFGIMVDYNVLSEENFKSAILEMLNNPKYTKKIQEVSARYRDQPMEPLELAIYWVEYIAKHKGAPHLHCAAQELNFFQYHNIDILFILLGAIVLLVFVIKMLIQKISSHSGANLKGKVKSKLN